MIPTKVQSSVGDAKAAASVLNVAVVARRGSLENVTVVRETACVRDAEVLAGSSFRLRR